MNRKDFKELLERYIADGFTWLELELTENRIIPLNCERNKICFNEDYFMVGTDSATIKIDYREITGIAI